EVLAADIDRASGEKPAIITSGWPSEGPVIVAGTLGKSSLVDELVEDGKLDVSDVEGRWETFVIDTVEAPASGIEQALVIAGSDKRGTLFGMLELSRRFGVSPWVYWADAPTPE